ncbi:thermonuclease family protein [Phenylobacterium montanum]|uniref:Thermonuclease family protein n=1 Tax=Phenylobacterium montanum TaxID=2823693 RepID=A0A975FZ70_9CAUL|nr:thermonuclease family protein [Caulobacter sp. S6]QUD87552.1 thermonuclease family protein [Caulobacter sp. S6]
MARRRDLVVSLAALALSAPLLTGCGEGRRLDRLAAGERGRVVEVRSGDVLVLDNGLVVRLVGLAAPRLGDPGFDQARAALAGLAQGQMVALYYGGAKRDPYGRALAQVRRLKDQAWLQGELLRAGWARVWTFADNRALASAMLADEARARAKGAGLWAMPDYKVLLPNEVGAAQHGFQIVEGRVLAVTEGKSGTFLDFSPDPAGFAVVIAPKDLPVLRAGGISPQAMASRLIRVRGVIGWGGVMSVDHPEQVEQLREP